MWLPQHDPAEDRYYHFFHRCDYCRPLKRACQHFGHVSPSCECGEPKLKTVQDRPVCEIPGCPKQDFLRPTHNLYQTFCDEEWNWFHVFFENVEQVESFFRHFPAEVCLNNSRVWCKFVSIVQYHKSLYASGEQKLSEITLKKERKGNGPERFVYISGFLSDSFE